MDPAELLIQALQGTLRCLECEQPAVPPLVLLEQAIERAGYDLAHAPVSYCTVCRALLVPGVWCGCFPDRRRAPKSTREVF